MKKSRIAKLSLMGASIAALAATLTTSTYAWYVSNKQADVEQATGTTDAAGADGSITLSWTNVDTEFYKNLTWAELATPTIASTSGVFAKALSPVYINTASATTQAKTLQTYKVTTDTEAAAGKTYYTKDANDVFTTTTFAVGAYELDTAEAASTAYIQFSMYIKAGTDNTAVTITPTFVNTTPTKPLQRAYVATGSIGQGQQFGVNAFDAMWYSIAIDGAAPSIVKAVSGTSATVDNWNSVGAAHSYYEAVSGTVIGSPYKTEPTDAGTLSITAGTTAKKLTWTIWLAGNDVNCYNSCAGQPFSLSIKYTA